MRPTHSAHSTRPCLFFSATLASEESHPDAVRQLLQIHQRQEINGLEFAVNCRRSADARGNIQVGSEQPRSLRRRGVGGVRPAPSPFHRIGPQQRLYKMLFPKRLVERHALVFVLRRQGTAANQITRSATLRVSGDPFPQHMQRVAVPVMLMNAGSAQFENLAANSLEGEEIEELFTVVAEVSLGAIPALHAVRSGQFSSSRIAHRQVVADKIEPVTVQAAPCRAVQSLAKLTIKDQIAKPLALDDLFQSLRHANAEALGCGNWISTAMLQDSGCWHA
jgi:hypothetical protein